MAIRKTPSETVLSAMTAAAAFELGKEAADIIAEIRVCGRTPELDRRSASKMNAQPSPAPEPDLPVLTYTCVASEGVASCPHPGTHYDSQRGGMVCDTHWCGQSLAEQLFGRPVLPDGHQEPPAGPSGQAPGTDMPAGANSGVVRPRPIPTSEEAMELEFCTQVIKRTLESLLEFGLAWSTIVRKGLYRFTHDTMEDWARHNCGKSARQIYRTIAAAEMIDGWKLSGAEFPMPAGEKTVRPLLQLAPEDRLPAWTEAVARHPHGHPSHKNVTEVVREWLGKAEPRPGNTVGDPVALAETPHPSWRTGKPVIDAGSRTDVLKAQAERTIADLRELLDLAGTADSQQAAGLRVALAQVQDYRDHLAKVEEMQAARP